MLTSNQVSTQESWNKSDTAEIIYLCELLKGPRERSRFIDLENSNPQFSKRIREYQRRVENGIWNLVSREFSEAFDEIYRITQTILQTRDEPVFSRSEIIDKISYLNLFECEYLLRGVNAAIYPESRTKLVSRIKD